MHSMLTALGARRTALQNEEGQKGFTLIELLVVVIIIGILAAIAIPVFLGVQSSAKDSAVQSDLTNLKVAAVAFQTENAGKLPANVAALSAVVAITEANYDTVAPIPVLKFSGTGKDAAFCIEAKGSNGNTWHVTSTTSPAKDACKAEFTTTAP